MKSHGENRTFKSGAVRDGGKKPALHLISPHAMNRLGEWLRYACEDRKPTPYPERNWEKGMPFSQTVASLARHVEAYKLGDETEDHIAAILFGGMTLAHFEEEIKAGRLNPNLDDMPHYVGRTNLEAKVQADLDRIFKNGKTVYATESVKKGQILQINIDGFNWSVTAAGDIPEGAPIRMVAGLPAPHSLVEAIPLGTRRVSPTGQEAVLVKWGTDLARGQDRTVAAVYSHEGGIEEVQVAPSPTNTGEAETPRICDRCNMIHEAAFPYKLEVDSLGHPLPGRPATTDRTPFTVYLCGPITGQKVDYLWRDAATAMLNAHGIKTLNPLRGKKAEDVSNLGLSYKGQLAAPEIAERDRLDIEEADMILAHFPYTPPRQSIGSWMEIGAAAIGFKKTVIFCTQEPVLNDHLFVRNFATQEPDFEQALNRIVAIATAKRR